MGAPMSSDMETEADRIRMALAEMGYTDAEVIVRRATTISGVNFGDQLAWTNPPPVAGDGNARAKAAWWAASELVSPASHPCWEHWDDGIAVDVQACMAGTCDRPDRWPPRELLRPR